MSKQFNCTPIAPLALPPPQKLLQQRRDVVRFGIQGPEVYIAAQLLALVAQALDSRRRAGLAEKTLLRQP